MKNFNATRLAVLGLGAVTFFGMAEGANAGNIVAGSDYLYTPSGSTYLDFPSIGRVQFQGTPINPITGLTDTIVQRKESAIFDTNGDNILDVQEAPPIPIQMTDLSLASIGPVKIGVSPNEYKYNLFARTNPDPLIPSTGTMTITHNGEVGQPFDDSGESQGTFSSILDVNFIVSFTPIDGGPSRSDQTFSKRFTNTDAPWSHNPVRRKDGPILLIGVGDQTISGGATVTADSVLANQHSADFATDFFPLWAPHDTGNGNHGVTRSCVSGYCRSFQPVPEPSTLLGSLLGLGAMLKLRRKVK